MMFRCLLLCVLAWPARAQVPDLFEVSATYLPDVAVAVPGAEGVRAQVSSYQVALNLPVVLGERTFLVPGVAYRADTVSYLGAPDGFDDLRAFHGIELPILFVQLLPRDWSLAIRVAPGLAGDLASVDGDSFRMSAAALAVHTFSEDVTLGGGVVASYGFGSFMVLPALYFSLGADTDPFGLELMVPAFAKLKARPVGGLELGLRAEVSGSSYAVRDPRIARRWPCVADASEAEPARCFDNLAYSVVSASAYVAVELWKGFWLDAAVGHTLYRRFESKNAAGGSALDGGQDLPNAIEVKVGVVFRLPRG